MTQILWKLSMLGKRSRRISGSLENPWGEPVRAGKWPRRIQRGRPMAASFLFLRVLHCVQLSSHDRKFFRRNRFALTLSPFIPQMNHGILRQLFSPVFYSAPFVLLLLTATSSWSQPSLVQELDLSGDWSFEIGDDPAWKERGFNDAKWEVVRVPGEWENQGFPGYDGFAWYRKRFLVPKELSQREQYLQLGRIDDVDVCYLNGKTVGSTGQFPPDYLTAWSDRRIYPIPEGTLRYGKENVIAIRVYDYHLRGGLYEGPVGLFSSRAAEISLKMDLSGLWKFKLGDNRKWSQPDYSASEWQSVPVPSGWEQVLDSAWDGIAWYRLGVTIPRDLAKEKLILLAGQIDDADETFFNGKMIGATGEFGKMKSIGCRECHLLERAYFLPPDLIAPGRQNIIAIRVWDRGGLGGIARGPIGIVTRREYLRHIRKQQK